MKGLRYDFEKMDIVLQTDGTFEETEIDSQNAALISMSQVCRISKPEVGERLAAKIVNAKMDIVSKRIASAKRAVEKDGGTNVIINVVEGNNLQFKAKYND